MMAHTPAQSFLSEVREINGFIDDILSCPRKSDWHWPSFYLLYVDADRLAMALARTEHVFGPPLFASPVPTNAEPTENSLAVLGEVGRHQKAIFARLYPMSRRIIRLPDNAALHARLEAHLHPKSGWHQEFLAQYDAGALSPDGTSLLRTVLPILAEPPYERIDHITASCMLRRQRFDVSTPEARKALADATREAAQTLGGIAARMQACFLAHCKFEDLLYPCSA